MKEKLVNLTRRYFPVRVGVCIIDDLIHGLGRSLGFKRSRLGATHASLDESESVAYIENVYTSYKRYAQLENFSGRIAEVGPGDTAGVALLMRKDGCEEADLIDRYVTIRKAEHQSKIYNALARRHSLFGFKSDGEWDDRRFAGITWKLGISAEHYFKDCSKKGTRLYDVIVSWTVLQHLYDPCLLYTSDAADE